jgi:BCCT family betaine/carnitine transporter
MSLATFQRLESLPFSGITTLGGVVLVLVFFVTSSDSGSLVMHGITAGGKHDAPVPQRIFRATMEGLLAGSLHYGGGQQPLAVLQAGTVAAGIPLNVVLPLVCVSL